MQKIWKKLAALLLLLLLASSAGGCSFSRDFKTKQAFHEAYFARIMACGFEINPKDYDDWGNYGDVADLDGHIVAIAQMVYKLRTYTLVAKEPTPDAAAIVALYNCYDAGVFEQLDAFYRWFTSGGDRQTEQYLLALSLANWQRYDETGQYFCGKETIYAFTNAELQACEAEIKQQPSEALKDNEDYRQLLDWLN